MTRVHIILALAAALALAGCATDSALHQSANATEEGWHTPDVVVQDNDGWHTPDVGVQNNGPAPQAMWIQTANSSNDDRRFMQDALSSGMFEVRAGTLALKNSASKRIQDAAQKLVDQHTDAVRELKRIAASKAITLSPELTIGQEAQIAKLEALQGSAFDTEFLHQQIRAHQDAIGEYEAAAERAGDTDLRALASTGLLSLYDELNLVNDENAVYVTIDR